MQESGVLTDEMEATIVRHEMTAYSGAPHAFTVFGSPRHREDTDKNSWKRFVESLDATLK